MPGDTAHVIAYIRFPPFYNIPILSEAQLTVVQDD